VPVIVIDQIDAGPPELGQMLPLRAELKGVIPGPDRPDYCVAQLERQIIYRPDPATFDESRQGMALVRRDQAGLPVILIDGVVLVAHLAGTQIAADMQDLWVKLAYIIDNTLPRDPVLDFAKSHYAGLVRINVDPSLERLFGT
jgi:hypothetical protein